MVFVLNWLTRKLSFLEAVACSSQYCRYNVTHSAESKLKSRTLQDPTWDICAQGVDSGYFVISLF